MPNEEIFVVGTGERPVDYLASAVRVQRSNPKEAPAVMDLIALASIVVKLERDVAVLRRKIASLSAAISVLKNKYERATRYREAMSIIQAIQEYDPDEDDDEV